MAHTNNMLDNMSDSECSDTSESGTSSSAASSNSSESEQSFQSLEPARILKQNLELPKGLCENSNIFNEFFSLDTWRCLPDHMKDQLKPFLPNFDDICTDEKEAQRETNATVQKLFTNQVTRFNASPLIDFQQNLEEGNYRPDISRLRANIQKSQRREQRFQECEHISRLAKSLVVSRERLLRKSYEGDSFGKSKRNSMNHVSPTKLRTSAASARAKKRYFDEINNILEEIGLESDFSDGDDFPDGSPSSLAPKKRNLSGNQVNLLGTGSEPRIINTMTQKGTVQMTNLPPLFNSYEPDEIYRELIRQHKARKFDDPEHSELDTSDIKLIDIYARTYNTPGRKPSAKSSNANANTNANVPTSTPTDTIKLEHDLNLDHTDTDIQIPGVNTSYDLATIEASHMNFSLAHNSSLVDKIIPTMSPTMNLIGDDQIKCEIKEEKPETDVCKQFLRDDDFKPLGENSSKKLMFGMMRSSEIKTSISDALISSPNVSSSLYIKDEDLNSSADTKFSDSLLPMVSTITTSPITLTSIANDMHSQNSPSDKLLKNNLSLSFGDKSMKSDSFSDLGGIDIMHLPVDLDDTGNMDILNDIVVDMKPELLQDTHACFLSLIRDIFCATADHRATLEILLTKISAWVANPITALNDWFGLADSWLELLPSAVYFLAGDFLDQPEDFVPYIEFKTNLNIYQWIGAGRDSDQRLKHLCEYWLRRRNEMGVKPQLLDEFETVRNKQHSSVEESMNNRLNSGERVASPPPPRCPTVWTVKPATDAEMIEFRKQERKRFESPHQAFTYRLHGYESVVGPVKGIYTHIPALTKARGHSMLTTDRPSFVTILTLVRDATARLPNGEGTRTDICELLKSSQYISPTASEQVLQTIVSGALDRMHTENDSCVRYDPKRKIWIYLHRNRSEEEFERMHQQFQGISKHKKQNSRKPKPKITTPKSGTTLIRMPENSPTETINVVLSPSIVSAANAPIPIGATPKKKVTIKTIPSAASNIEATNATLTPTSSQIHTIPATVRISQPTILSTVTSPPVPALSSISSPILSSTNPPPLINKIITTPKSSICKPELVPIQKMSQDDQIDMDSSTNLDAPTPLIVNKPPTVQNQAQITGIILDKNQTINSKMIGKPSIGIVSGSSPGHIKLTTSGGIQTVHVSSGHAIIRPQQGSILQAGNQSILSPNQIRAVRPQHGQLPPLVAAQTTGNHSYMIPISMGKSITNKTIQPIVSQSTSSPKTIKATNLPVTGNKTIIRTQASNIPPGASLINPSVVAANNIALQKQTPTTMQIIQTKPLQQQKIIVASGANVIGGNANKATIVGTSQSGTPIVVQKIIAVSKPLTSGSNAIVTTSPSSISSAMHTTTPPGTSLISPQFIQIHQTNTDKSPQGAKVQMISTANLSPLQQQNLLQRINKQIRAQGGQAIGTSQQNLIIKPQQVLQATQQSIQKTMQTTQIQLSPVKTSTIDAQIQLVTSGSNTITAPIISRANLKLGTSLIQSSATTTPVAAVRTVSTNNSIIGKVITDQSGQIISLENLMQQKPNMGVPSVRITGGKAGQTTNLIQLPSAPGSQITQYAVVSQGRNLISVAQPRFITTQALNTNSTTFGKSSGNVVSVSGVKTAAGISVLSNTNALQKTEGLKIGQRLVAQPTIIQSNQPTSSQAPKIIQSAQLQPISTQQLINAKVLGVQGFQGLSQATSLNQRVKAGASIRMVNASNLNFANIDGKQVIIASKTPTLIQSPNQQINKTTHQVNRSNIVWQQSNNITSSGSNIISTIPQAQIQQASGQTVMFGNQVVKIQPHQTVTSVPKPSTSTVSVLSSTGQTIKVHTPNVITTTAGMKPNIKNVIKGTNLTASPGQRVVLAVQGGGQILLPQNFQGGSINLKALQGLKMIPIQQTTQHANSVQLTPQSTQKINPPTSSSAGDS